MFFSSSGFYHRSGTVFEPPAFFPVTRPQTRLSTTKLTDQRENERTRHELFSSRTHTAPRSLGCRKTPREEQQRKTEQQEQRSRLWPRLQRRSRSKRPERKTRKTTEQTRRRPTKEQLTKSTPQRTTWRTKEQLQTLRHRSYCKSKERQRSQERSRCQELFTTLQRSRRSGRSRSWR